MQNIIITFLFSILTAILAATLTSILTKRREMDSDWRKIKYAHYQDYISALSGIVEGRSSEESQKKYCDAVNRLQLIAPEDVLSKLDNYLRETSYRNQNRNNAEHDRLLDELFHAMRSDMHRGAKLTQNYHLHLIAPPPDTGNN